MHVCMYVCMYACMHVCMYACMHVCMYACMHVCMYACMHACMHVCMYACMHVCMYACMHVCMYVCMYVCMHACMHACMYVCMGPQAVASTWRLRLRRRKKTVMLRANTTICPRLSPAIFVCAGHVVKIGVFCIMANFMLYIGTHSIGTCIFWVWATQGVCGYKYDVHTQYFHIAHMHMQKQKTPA